MSTQTPEQVLEAVVEGINTGNFQTLMLSTSLRPRCDSAREPRSRTGRDP